MGSSNAIQKNGTETCAKQYNLVNCIVKDVRSRRLCNLRLRDNFEAEEHITRGVVIHNG